MTKRLHNKPWKRIYGIDRGYTARVDRAKARAAKVPPPLPTVDEMVERERSRGFDA